LPPTPEPARSGVLRCAKSFGTHVVSGTHFDAVEPGLGSPLSGNTITTEMKCCFNAAHCGFLSATVNHRNRASATGLKLDTTAARRFDSPKNPR
jgi:hypothetical protein